MEELELEMPKVEASKNTSTEVKEVDEYVVVVRSGEDQEKHHETVELKLESIEVTKVKEDEVEELICEKESPRAFKNKRKSKADDQITVTNENNKNLCTICNKFVARLNQHMRIHDDSPEYRCEYCNKGFHQHSNLKKHVRTHTKVLFDMKLLVNYKQSYYILGKALHLQHLRERIHQLHRAEGPLASSHPVQTVSVHAVQQGVRNVRPSGPSHPFPHGRETSRL